MKNRHLRNSVCAMQRYTFYIPNVKTILRRFCQWSVGETLEPPPFLSRLRYNKRLSIAGRGVQPGVHSIGYAVYFSSFTTPLLRFDSVL